MKDSWFSFKLTRSLNIRYDKVNKPKGSSYIKSTKWLRWKNTTKNPENINDRCFQIYDTWKIYAFALTQHHK